MMTKKQRIWRVSFLFSILLISCSYAAFYVKQSQFKVSTFALIVNIQSSFDISVYCRGLFG